MNIDSLISANEQWMNAVEPPCPVILSSRIRLARNLVKYPFPGWANPSQRQELLATLCDALCRLPEMKEATVLSVAELSELEKLVLVERHLMSRELSGASAGAGMVISKNQNFAVMINEEDHLRLQVMQNGFKLDEIWTLIDNLDSGIERQVEYAFSPELGYLTACPTNVGTGMRASVMMHLPGLVLIEHMEKVIRALNQLGLAVRGVLGEGSEASGSVFQISNQQTLGESEVDIIHRLSNVLRTIIQQEKNARQKLFESNSRKILDKIGRSYGALQNAHLLTSSESMNLLSLMRLAVDMQLLPEDRRGLIDRLFIDSQPGHIQYNAHGDIEPSRRDALRADLMRTHFNTLPPLNFSNRS